MAQWVWNLRLELGHHLKPMSLRTTEFAPALSDLPAGQAPSQGYESPVIGGAWKAGRFSGQDFLLQPDGTLRCPAGSVLLHPLVVGSAPLQWRDWSRRYHRRACMHLLSQQRVEVQVASENAVNPTVTPPPLSRVERAHYRLSWADRLARNTRTETSAQVMVRLFGVPEAFSTVLELPTA
ncbi:MAG TPA: hypothetical protein VF844_03530 [Ktedonobacteraceae bacterium]